MWWIILKTWFFWLHRRKRKSHITEWKKNQALTNQIKPLSLYGWRLVASQSGFSERGCHRCSHWSKCRLPHSRFVPEKRKPAMLKTYEAGTVFGGTIHKRGWKAKMTLLHCTSLHCTALHCMQHYHQQQHQTDDHSAVPTQVTRSQTVNVVVFSLAPFLTAALSHTESVVCFNTSSFPQFSESSSMHRMKGRGPAAVSALVFVWECDWRMLIWDTMCHSNISLLCYLVVPID